jgi:hypothetical protein
MLAGFINWDMLPVALTALGFMFWARRKPGLSGVMFGLGMAAKLYPVLLLGPLLLLCLRGRKMRDFGRLMIGFAIAWLVPNLPVLILAPGQWLTFWSFNSDRGGDLGSIWYVLSLAGHAVPHLNLVNTVILLLLCAAIGWLIIAAPRRPRFAQVGYLVIAAFLITNKVYSPQYVLWLLPLLILARPRWREWWIFTIGELCYFFAIWGHLDQTLGPANGGPDRLYWAAVVIRIGCEVWVGIMIIRDILDPDRRDPLRAVPGPGLRGRGPAHFGRPVRNWQPPNPHHKSGPDREPDPELVEGPESERGLGLAEAPQSDRGPEAAEGPESDRGPEAAEGPEPDQGPELVEAPQSGSTHALRPAQGSSPRAHGFSAGDAVPPVGGDAAGAVAYGPVTDGPAEGVLTGAADAPWVNRLRSWLDAGDTGAR